MSETNAYIPGVCNIGRAEIANGNRQDGSGHSYHCGLVYSFCRARACGVATTAVYSGSMAASGFLQAYMHFCAGFGSRGLFNFGPKAGKTETVMQAEFRPKTGKKPADPRAFPNHRSGCRHYCLFVQPK